MAITLRTTKGSALTHTEMDTNFSELDSRIIDSGGVASIARSVALDSAEAFQLLLDSSEIVNLIDSSYINTYATNPAAVSTLIASEGYTKIDSADTMGIIDSHVDVDFIAAYVDSAFVALRAPDYVTYYEDEVKGTVDSDYIVLKQRQYTFAGDFQSDTEAFIDSNYVQARQLFNNFIDSAAVLDISLANIVEDQSPELGGDLNLQRFGLQYTFTITAYENTAYIFSDSAELFFPTSELDPDLYLRRGERYLLNNITGGHPMEIQDSDGNAYETGVINNRDSDGTGQVIVTPSMTAPLRLRYQCTTHDSMGGIINIV